VGAMNGLREAGKALGEPGERGLMTEPPVREPIVLL
jgi:hypothetical protein